MIRKINLESLYMVNLTWKMYKARMNLENMQPDVSQRRLIQQLRSKNSLFSKNLSQGQVFLKNMRVLLILMSQ